MNTPITKDTLMSATKMPSGKYSTPIGGLPDQGTRMDERAVFTEAYAFLPASTMRDIVTSNLPFWESSRAWILSRPLSGFAETFSQYIMDVAPGGGSDRPETDPRAEAVIFVVGGGLKLTISGEVHSMEAGGYAYLPAGCEWSARNVGDENCQFHWIRKAYDKVEDIDAPEPFVTRDQDVEPTAMPGTDGKWTTSRFVDPSDMRHDMHVTIVTFDPGAVIPFPETHVMEHGLFVLEGKAVYKLNQDWVEVEAGDYMWLRAFCPQACYAAGTGKFRYLLYKDVNRHMKL